jgi:hypothetical protein
MLFYLRLADLVYFATLLPIQGVHSLGSYYMSVDRYLQLGNGTMNCLQVSKYLYKNEAVRCFSLTLVTYVHITESVVSCLILS